MLPPLVQSLALTAALTVVAEAQAPVLIVLNKSEASASLISISDGSTIAKLPVGEGPHEVAVSPDGRWAVVANYGTGQAPGSTLTVLDTRARRVERTINLGAYRRPHGIAYFPDGRRVLVTAEASQALVIVDVATGRVERVIKTNQNGTHLFVMAPDGRRAWTSNIGAGTVTLVDLERGEVVKTAPAGRGPEAIDLSPDGREVWTGDSQLDRILVLDANTLDTLASMPSGGRPNRVHFTRDGRWVFESNIRTNNVMVYDARARRHVETIEFPTGPPAAGSTTPATAVPEGILMAPDGRRVWVALAGTDRIAEIDIATRKVLRYFETGRAPDGMALVP